MNSRTIVISAVNLTSGGPLTILQECLGYLNSSPLLATYEVIALVHDRKLADFPHIRFNSNRICGSHCTTRLRMSGLIEERYTCTIRSFSVRLGSATGNSTRHTFFSRCFINICIGSISVRTIFTSSSKTGSRNRSAGRSESTSIKSS